MRCCGCRRRDLKQRSSADGSVAAGGVVIERKITGGRVVVAAGVAKKRPFTGGRVSAPVVLKRAF